MIFKKNLLKKNTPSSFSFLSEILALTVWSESAGCGLQGAEAITASFINRAKINQNGLANICLKKTADPFWNQKKHQADNFLDEKKSFKRLKLCRRIAKRALKSRLKTNIYGATHYHRIGDFPEWSFCHFAIAEIEGYFFYQLP